MELSEIQLYFLINKTSQMHIDILFRRPNKSKIFNICGVLGFWGFVLLAVAWISLLLISLQIPSRFYCANWNSMR